MPGTAPLRANDPERLGAYRLIGRLGEGGQGVVYLGEGPDGARVAVKLLHAQFTGDAKMRARFAGELTSAKRVAPFCTARIIDADVDGDVPYLVSEFIDGPSLRGVVDAEGPRTGSPLRRLAIGTATALAAIHAAGIVHRDFKPTNVLLAADGPRVIDFGIARALDAAGTVTSTTVGTPSYMSPEQIAGDFVGPASDVFAWGCTIAYAATGVPPFGQDSIPAVMNRIVHQEPGLGRLTGTLREIVTACLAKDPRRRPTAQEILVRLLAEEGVVLSGRSGARSSDMLNRGAQVAAENTPPPGWTPPPGAPGIMPPPVPQGPAGNTPPPAARGSAGNTPPPGGPAGNTPPPGGPAGNTPPPATRVPAGDTPPPERSDPGSGAPPSAEPAPSGPRRRVRPGVLAAAAAALVLLGGAGAIAATRLTGGHEPAAGRLGGTFRMAMYPPAYIDPSNARLAADFFAVRSLFTGLSEVRPDGSIGPALATQATHDAKCTRWRFTLRQGTRFSNGDAVDAAAFARGWNRIARNQSNTEAYLLSDIEGYADVQSGKATALTGVSADGSGTLRVTLTKPDCEFANRVAAPVFAPVPAVAGEPSNAAYNRLPIGNGPYRVARYVPNSHLTLVRNTSYAFARPRLDRVDITFLTDLGRAPTGFDAHRYDWAELQLSSVPAARLSHGSDGRLVRGATGGMTYLLPIGDKSPMDSKDARLAVSYALDRQVIVDSVYQGMYAPATSLVPPAIPGANVTGCAACTPNAARAKSLAARAGLGPGSKVTFTIGDSSSYTRPATEVRQQLTSVLGWDVQLRRLPVDRLYRDETGTGAYGLYLFSWIGDYPSAENYLYSLLSSEAIHRSGDGPVGKNNYARYRSDAFDAAINAARATSDPAQRLQRLQAAEKIALDDMALIPLYSHSQYRLADTKGFADLGMDYLGYPTLLTTARR